MTVDVQSRNHRPTFSGSDGQHAFTCDCGATGTSDTAFGAIRDHDQHVTDVNPNLRCSRCGSRHHGLEFCQRGA